MPSSSPAVGFPFWWSSDQRSLKSVLKNVNSVEIGEHAHPGSQHPGYVRGETERECPKTSISPGSGEQCPPTSSFCLGCVSFFSLMQSPYFYTGHSPSCHRAFVCAIAASVLFPLGMLAAVLGTAPLLPCLT